MPRCFVYIPQPNCEVIFNPDAIQFIHKRETGIYIKFLTDDEALHLEGEAAKAYWDEVYDLSNRFPKPDEEPFDPTAELHPPMM
jgi:hypothetical protein